MANGGSDLAEEEASPGVTVELYGIPRQRAGTAAAHCRGGSLGDVLRELADRYPELAATCIDDDRLRPGYLANLDGGLFLQDPATMLEEGATLLLMSADAGG